MEYTNVLETSGLSHRFTGGQSVLSNINLQVPSGSIFGFLGPNGAGKTTTLRLILGLLKKQSGRINILNKSFDHHRIEILEKTGAMIESPSLYGHLTAADNLRVLQKIYRCPDKRIHEVLSLVGLSETGTKKASRFSLGMKQRLSIAMALLHEPELLILDEPTNGLDPNGMIEVRELLLYLNQEQGVTIVISSHLLGEIEKMVSHVGIIHHGRLLFQGTLGQLQQQRSAGSRLHISTSNNIHAAGVLRAHGFETKSNGQQLSLHLPAPEVTGQMARYLVEAGIDLYELSPVQNDLEGIFMEMITD